MSLYVPTKNKIASPYMPTTARVERAIMLTEKEKFFAVSSADKALYNYRPGQFFMAGLPGYGEGPFSISSMPADDNIELCIRAVGNLTNALHRLDVGDNIYLRGPYGRGFDVASVRGKDIVFFSGGIGMVPMRSLVRMLVQESESFRSLNLIYGSKTPADVLFTKELEGLSAASLLNVHLTVDKPDADWKGEVGTVISLIPKMDVDWESALAVIIGPPVMYKFVIFSLLEKGMRKRNILLSLERRMKCGVGKCGHCQINSQYVCQCGPVFSLAELGGLPEAY